MSERQIERFTNIRQLASIENALGRLALLPGDLGIAKRRVQLRRDRAEILARLASKV